MTTTPEQLLALVERLEKAPIKALSIRQPWIHHILHDGKDVENRDWHTGFRGWVLLHASKNETEDREMIREMNLPIGGICGAVEIVDCVSKWPSKWFVGDYGFVLKHPIELPFVPLKGALGFFEVPHDVRLQCLSALRARTAQ